MPTVPTYQPGRIRPQPVAEQPQRAPSARDILGGGNGIGEIAQATKSIADTFADMALENKRRDDARAVMGAERAASERLRDLTIGENGWLTRQGENAVGISEAAPEAMSGVYDEIVEGLDGPDQRAAFDRMWASRYDSTMNRLARHESSERARANEIAQQATITSAIEDVATNYADPEAIAAALTRGEAVIGANIDGAPAEAVEQRLEAFRSQVHATALDRLVTKDLRAAQVYLRANADEMTGTDQARVEKWVRTARRSAAAASRRARSDAEKALTAEAERRILSGEDPRNLPAAMQQALGTRGMVSGLNFRDRLEEADQPDRDNGVWTELQTLSVSDPDEFLAVDVRAEHAAALPEDDLRALEKRQIEVAAEQQREIERTETAAEAADRKAAFTRSKTLILDGAEPDDLPASDLEMLGPDDVARLDELAAERRRDREAETDNSDYTRLQTLKAERPAEFAREDLDRYRLSEADQRRLASDQAEIAAGTGTSVQNDQQRVRRALTSIGIDPNSDDDDDAQKIRRFYQSYEAAVDEARSASGGKALTAAEKEGILDRLILDGDVDGRGFLGFGSGARYFELTPEERADFTPEDVPEGPAREARQYLRRTLGRDPTEDEILDLYTEYLRGL